VVNETEHAETVPHAFCGVNAPRVEVLVPEILEMSEDYRHVATRCPQCNYKMNAATNVHGGDLIPQKGDTSVCINCGQVLKYEADLTLRKATPLEIRELMQDATVWAVIEKAQRFIQRRGKFA
jgi:transcription elongation factor Elf1